jgi:hypothetical protein
MIPTIAASASGMAKVTAIEKTEVVTFEDCIYKYKVEIAIARV